MQIGITIFSQFTETNHLKNEARDHELLRGNFKCEKSLAETETRLLLLAQEITLGDQFHLLDGVEILYEQKEIQESYLNTACANFSDFLKTK